MESVYKTQCKTYAIACDVTKNYFNATSIESSFKPPFCLRIVKQYRTKEMQAFRDKIACDVKLIRNTKHL